MAEPNDMSIESIQEGAFARRGVLGDVFRRFYEDELDSGRLRRILGIASDGISTEELGELDASITDDFRDIIDFGLNGIAHGYIAALFANLDEEVEQTEGFVSFSAVDQNAEVEASASGGEGFDKFAKSNVGEIILNAAMTSNDSDTVESALVGRLPETMTVRTEVLGEVLLRSMLQFGASVYVQGGRDAVIARESQDGEFDEDRFVPQEYLLNMVLQSRDTAGFPLTHQGELLDALKTGQGVLINQEPTDGELFGKQGEEIE